MGEAEQLSCAIAKLYAAALDPALWRQALVGVEDFTGCTGAVIDLIPIQSGVRPATLSGSFSQEDCAEYALNYQSICPRIAFAVQHPEVKTQFDRLVLSEAEMDMDPVYEWFGKHGLRYYIGGNGGGTSLYQSFFSLQRSRRQGHVDSEDVARFELIRPHIAQALSVAVTLGTLSSHRSFSDAMLDAMPQAVFGLGSDGVLLFANSSAERLLSLGVCLDCEQARLTTADPSQQEPLERLIADSISGSPVPGNGTLLIRRRNGGRPFAARVIRIVAEQIDPMMRPSLLLIVNNPEAAADLDDRTLQALFGLTSGETRVAAALLQGHSLQSAAELLQSSVETLRCHLKSIFRKVGVSRQQDLVRVLAELEMGSITGQLHEPTGHH